MIPAFKVCAWCVGPVAEIPMVDLFRQRQIQLLRARATRLSSRLEKRFVGHFLDPLL